MPRRPAQGQLAFFRERRERHAVVDDPDVVLNAAARFLQARSRSVDEVRRHLTGAGYRDDLVEAAVARLLDLGMLDDRAFGRAWVESRDRARPRGEQTLRRELAMKGIDREVIGEILEARREAGKTASGAEPQAGAEERGSPDELAAERLLSKRAAALMRVSDPRERRNRAYSLLARNGFDPDVCREASGRFLATLGPESDVTADAADIE
jgi:regulatory protein